ncbi:tetratricopeptide repeat protein [Cecembia calidifontis]|uniref:Tetratricopeptide repeat protein n=1 Tax=Cecembia calidifontis TaxID=1187080 RepID=A0A4Q7PC72_9BACT|nr:tetratricopeptide repeat protein [Cecembia calidifontis]RZS97943.1 tetratricopeptide repeat protein [Cecembia calidifontis]
MEILIPISNQTAGFQQILFRPVKYVFIVLALLLAGQTMAQENIIHAFKKSYDLEKKGNFKSAADQLRSVYQDDSYEINLRLGWLSYQGGQLKESIDYYQKAVNLKPYAIEPKLGLVLPLSVQGEWDKIIEIYQKILQIDPQNSLVNYRMGLIYYNRGNYDKADPYIEKVVNLYPFDYDGLLLLAWNKLYLQKMRESKVLFQKVLMYHPEDESALEGLKLIK